MQNPAQEVEYVVKALVEARDATEQAIALRTYYTPNASFDHPLCSVTSGKQSRDHGLLQIYQWLRCMSNSTIVVHSKAFDSQKNQLFLEATQTLRPTLAPFVGIPAKIFVVLRLVKGNDGKYYVLRQEDYYAIQELPGKLAYFGGPFIINTAKTFAGFMCYLLALWFGIILGFWKPRPIGPRK